MPCDAQITHRTKCSWKARCSASTARRSTKAPWLDRLRRARLTQARQVLNVIEAGQESAEALQIPVSSPVAELRRYACIDDNVVYYARLEFPFRKVRMEFDLLAGR